MAVQCCQSRDRRSKAGDGCTTELLKAGKSHLPLLQWPNCFCNNSLRLWPARRRGASVGSTWYPAQSHHDCRASTWSSSWTMHCHWSDARRGPEPIRGGEDSVGIHLQSRVWYRSRLEWDRPVGPSCTPYLHLSYQTLCFTAKITVGGGESKLGLCRPGHFSLGHP
jgi:hypothetical protein